MKKKGFTLIELLAVIVILAIIALIATPIVMNVIENSRKGAAERSAENYLRAVETAVMETRMDGPVTDGEYEVDGNGDLVLQNNNTIKIEVEVSGNAPKPGTIIVIVNGLVDKTQVIIVIGDYTVTDEDGDGKLESEKTPEISEEESAEISAEKYLSAVETTIANLDGSVMDGTYKITAEGKIKIKEDTSNSDPAIYEYPVEINGDKPSSGVVVIKNGQISDYAFIIGTKQIKYDSTKQAPTASNITTICEAVETLSTEGVGLLATNEKGPYAPGVEYKCNVTNTENSAEYLTFFVLEEDENNVSLILNRNIKKDGVFATAEDKGTVSWIDEVDYGCGALGSKCSKNDKGPITVLKHLKTATQSWSSLSPSQISLPTHNQIHSIFKSSGVVRDSSLSWLYGYLDQNPNKIKEMRGYWTSTAYSLNDYEAYSVFSNRYVEASSGFRLWSINVYATINNGIRPVITIDKSQLN